MIRYNAYIAVNGSVFIVGCALTRKQVKFARTIHKVNIVRRERKRGWKHLPVRR